MSRVRGFVLDKCSRSYIEDRLAAADNLCGYERELLARIKASHCDSCRGSGYAPYVGGDNDTDPCVDCCGSGFRA